MSTEELTELLQQTGHHHHQAFIDSNGIDPEWALWYAGYLQAHMWDQGGSLPSRSRLIQLLLNAEEEFNASGDDGPWHPSYAAHILQRLSA